MDMTLIQKICIWILPVLFAIIFHEVAHGWVALKFGDKTALMLGRLSVNPLKHIDPIGTILVPGILLVLGGVIFGWAKPVPINARNFKNPRRDMAVVAMAFGQFNYGINLGTNYEAGSLLNQRYFSINTVGLYGAGGYIC